MKNKNGFVIFRAWITKDGKRIYARDYGHKAFCIVISKERI